MAWLVQLCWEFGLGDSIVRSQLRKDEIRMASGMLSPMPSAFFVGALTNVDLMVTNRQRTTSSICSW
jgi:hypothetical protein